MIDNRNQSEETLPDVNWIVRANEIRGLAALLLKFFNDDVSRRMQNSGVTLSGLQFGILQMLQAENLTISTFSLRMGMDPSSILRIIDLLEQKGLVTRGADPYDRRRHPIQLTSQGRALLAAMPVISEEDLAFKAVQSLGEGKSLQLRDLLIKVLLSIPEGRVILESAPRPPDYVEDPEDTARPESTPRLNG